MTDQERQEALVARLREIVGPMVAEAVEAQYANLDETRAAGGTDIADLARALRETPVPGSDERGKNFARMAWAMASAFHLSQSGRAVSAIERAADAWGPESNIVRLLEAGQERALQSDDFDAGGAFVGETITNDIIELLRAKSLVRSMGATTLPNPTGNLTMRKLTGGSTSTYIGEGENIPSSQPSTGQVRASAKTLATLVPISNQLLRRADPRTETVIRDDIVASMRTKEDITFIRGIGSDATPKGIKAWTAAGNVLASATSTPGSVTLANVTDDLGRMLQALMDSNAPMERMGWMMEPRTWRYLFTLRDGNGNFAFKAELDNGRLFGFPVGFTTQIPRNLDASGDTDNDETEVYLVDFSQVVIADTLDIALTAHEGAYFDTALGGLKSAISANETVIRAITEHDLVVRHSEAIAILENVVWGA